jgi:hypothetical protein
VEFSETGWVFEAPNLGVIGFGEHRHAAAEDFRSDFMAMYDRIGLAPDTRLTPEALRIKQTFHSLVGSIEVPE